MENGLRLSYYTEFEVTPIANFLIELVLDHGHKVFTTTGDDGIIHFTIGSAGAVDEERRKLLWRIMYVTGVGKDGAERVYARYLKAYGKDEFLMAVCIALESFYTLYRGRFPDDTVPENLEDIVEGMEFFTDETLISVDDMRVLFERLSIIYQNLNR